jgi:hypothetical protein
MAVRPTTTLVFALTLIASDSANWDMIEILEQHGRQRLDCAAGALEAGIALVIDKLFARAELRSWPCLVACITLASRQANKSLTQMPDGEIKAGAQQCRRRCVADR